MIPTFTPTEQLVKQKQIFKDYYIYVGQLVEEKGIIQLLNLFINQPKLNLIVIGDNTNSFYRKYAEYQNIRFLGFKPKKITLSYMKNANATILPSLWYDVLPNVLIESFSVGTPVIAPNIGVFPTVIHHKKTGLIYPNNNRYTLTKYLNTFKKSRTIIQNVIVDYQKNYVLHQHENALNNIYNMVQR